MPALALCYNPHMPKLTDLERFYASIRPDYQWGFIAFLIVLLVFAILSERRP